MSSQTETNGSKLMIQSHSPFLLQKILKLILYIYIYIYIFIFFSIMVYPRTLNTVPCAIQYGLVILNISINLNETSCLNYKSQFIT